MQLEAKLNMANLDRKGCKELMKERSFKKAALPALHKQEPMHFLCQMPPSMGLWELVPQAGKLLDLYEVKNDHAMVRVPSLLHKSHIGTALPVVRQGVTPRLGVTSF